eukprot:CAMPEP_0175557258 /NCGR_PEP_ID=MMETSP0096-20121207/35283_1 /TAXON_ID=311494 /ORGANISM="Alexandrium monilatum, Strain CCMP3105" /LENGTH=310 /DNA_ID=CAMNT_0016860403 /DNA_START=34 /DNA_END=965 /DNA_ORIENTATION=+
MRVQCEKTSDGFLWNLPGPGGVARGPDRPRLAELRGGRELRQKLSLALAHVPGRRPRLCEAPTPGLCAPRLLVQPRRAAGLGASEELLLAGGGRGGAPAELPVLRLLPQEGGLPRLARVHLGAAAAPAAVTPAPPPGAAAEAHPLCGVPAEHPARAVRELQPAVVGLGLREDLLPGVPSQRTAEASEGAAWTATRGPGGTSKRRGPGLADGAPGQTSSGRAPTVERAGLPARTRGRAPRDTQPGAASSLTQPSNVSLTALRSSPLALMPSIGASLEGLSCTLTASSRTSNCWDGSTCDWDTTPALEAVAA